MNLRAEALAIWHMLVLHGLGALEPRGLSTYGGFRA